MSISFDECSLDFGSTSRLAYFYTFVSVEGYQVSVTADHYIVVLDLVDKKRKPICAAQVTLKHQLIMLGRTIGLAKILYSQRIDFSAPMTMTGYLLVNNISTSTYIDF